MRNALLCLWVLAVVSAGSGLASAQSGTQSDTQPESAAQPGPKPGPQSGPQSFPQSIYEQILVMAGPLTKGHAKLEKKCSNCHIAKTFKTAPNKLCTECHKPIAQDISGQLGYHGRRGDIAKGRACKSCHTEHKGRGYDIVALDVQLFDHALTDFVLKGAHLAQRSNCTSCHAPGETYAKALNECVDCHGAFETDSTIHKANDPRKYRVGRTSDPHSGRLTDCVSCHEQSSWSKLKPFNHSMATKRPTRHGFPLIGKHAKITCDACHKLQHKVHAVPRGCVTCHKQNDNHDGKFGETCNSCHTEKGWKLEARCKPSRKLKGLLKRKLSVLQIQSLLNNECGPLDPRFGRK